MLHALCIMSPVNIRTEESIFVCEINYVYNSTPTSSMQRSRNINPFYYLHRQDVISVTKL